MSLTVDIQKKLGDFQLHVQFDTDDQPLALLGASGCGKSLTLRCIAGILTPDQGKIILNGQTLFDSAAHIDLPPQQRRVGYLFQQYALFPNMSVRKNIAVAVPRKEGREQVVREKLRQFRLEAVADLRPGQLSGGQQQRTALARILASEPQAILLDEPLSALDSYLRYQLELELTETLEQFHGPVLWVSHDRGEVYRNCKNVCVLDRGRSQPLISLTELIHQPGTEAAARLSGCKNYADAVPQGSSIFLPEWGLTLSCGREVPDAVNRVGIRAHHIQPTETGIPCRVLRIIEDVFSTVILLMPDSAREGAPALRMELEKDVWAQLSNRDHIHVTIDPNHILLLQSEGGNL